MKKSCKNLSDICPHSLEDVTLSTRTVNALRRSGIHTLNELLCLSKEDLLQIRGIGSGGVTEILNLHGILCHQECGENLETLDKFIEIIQPICKMSRLQIGVLFQKHDLYIESFDFSNESELSKLFKIEEFKQAVVKNLRILLCKPMPREKFLKYLQNSRDPEISCAIYAALLKNKITDMIFDYVVLYRKPLASIICAIEKQEFLSRDYMILLSRLQGEAYESIGKKYHLTRERIRQIATKQVHALPLLMEDYYSEVYSHFNLSLASFLELFQDMDSRAFYYLSLRYPKGRVDLDDFPEYRGIFSEKIFEYLEQKG